MPRAQQKPFKRRVVPDRVDLRDRPYMPAVTLAPPPRFSILDRCTLDVLHQGDTNACTGFSLAQVVNTLLQRARRTDHPVSPFMLYSMARRYDEFAGDADEGSSLRGAMKGWFKHGVCSAKLWKMEPMPTPRSHAQDWWPDAATRPLGAYYRVDTRSVTDMHVALIEGGILYASAICHSGWDAGLNLPRPSKTWRIPYTAKASPSDGGHAFAIVGYDEHGFLILNSWGQEWGANGTATLTYEDWLDNAMDCWVAQLGVTTDQHIAVAQARTLRTHAGKVTLASDVVLRDREISPFVIDMENNGSLSRSGTFRTNPSDLTALVDTQMPLARSAWGLGRDGVMDVAIYAHGGLTGEATAAATAARWIPALYQQHIFPIFLMWESDLLSTIKNRLADIVVEILAKPRPTAGLRDQLERFLDERIERTLVRPGSWLWDEMKDNAIKMSEKRKVADDAEQSGARLLYDVCARSKTFRQAAVRLHLIGHSAGAIVHSQIVHELGRAGWKFATVNFLAPAVRVDTFEDTIGRALAKGTVGRYHQLHLADSIEQNDETCRALLGYSRSLLYLVSQSFEHGKPTPILGMERYFRPFEQRCAAAVRARMQAWESPGAESRSTTHGGFDDDARALETVIALIRGKTPAAATVAPEVAVPAPTRAGRMVVLRR